MKTKELISKESELQALVIKMVQRVGQKLPQQNPLDQFIHNNLLMPFENEPFWEGVKRASVLYQGATTRRLEWYHSRCNDGSISARALNMLVLLMPPAFLNADLQNCPKATFPQQASKAKPSRLPRS